MPDTENTVDAETTIRERIQPLLERGGRGDLTVRPNSKLAAELGLDSLELAELSAVLEDDLGRDPFSEGIIPDTVGDLIDFYNS